MIAGERDGWDYVWPRDAAAGAIALRGGRAAFRGAARGRLRRRASTSRWRPLPARRRSRSGSPRGGGRGRLGGGRSAATGSAGSRVTRRLARSPGLRRERHRGPARQRDRGRGPGRRDPRGFLGPRGLTRKQGGDVSSIRPRPGRSPSFPSGICAKRPGAPCSRWRESRRPTASRRSRVGRRDRSGPRRRPGRHGRWRSSGRRKRPTACCGSSAARPPRTKRSPSESAHGGHPTSTTPLAWSHAFAVLALAARYPELK